MSTHPLLKAERGRAFADAVIAIAMTLLILPLMETVGETAQRGEGATHWLSAHSDQLVCFVLSFVLTMITISALLLAQRIYLTRHPELHHAPAVRLRMGIAAELATIACFVIALGVMLAVPSWGYYPLFVMFLSGVIQRVVARRMGVTEP